MQIEYSGSRTLKDLQQDFSQIYPYLKLDFKTAAGTDMQNAAVLGNLNHNIIPGYIEITTDMTVEQLEKLFITLLQLPVKVLRKSGNIWMQTSITNNWTLGQQNAHAKEISTSRIY